MPQGITMENDKLKLWKKYNDLLSDGTVENNLTCPESPRLDTEKTRQLLYDYAGKGLVEKLDNDFFVTTSSVIDIGDDKVSCLLASVFCVSLLVVLIPGVNMG
jgi:hypothetical protein